MDPQREEKQLIRRTNCFYKVPKSLKQAENDLEQLYLKVQKLLAPKINSLDPLLIVTPINPKYRN